MARSTKLEALSLGGLAVRLDEINRAVQKDINRLSVDIASNIAYEVAKRTPVDTAYARANWITSLKPTNDVLMPYKAYPSRYRRNRRGNLGKGGSFTERVNSWGVRNQAASALIRKEPEDDVYITNNTPYIGFLDKGTSKQAPAGFVGMGITAGVAAAVKAFRFEFVRKLK